jgi:hypothetical protein
VAFAAVMDLRIWRNRLPRCGDHSAPAALCASRRRRTVQLGLEIDVVRQLDVLDEAGRLDVVAVHQDEFLVLRGAPVLSSPSSCPAQRAVDQAHRDGLAFGLAEDQAIAAGELRRLGAAALELVHRLAFGQLDLADLDGEAQLGDVDLDRDGADAISPTKAWVRP